MGTGVVCRHGTYAVWVSVKMNLNPFKFRPGSAPVFGSDSRSVTPAMSHFPLELILFNSTDLTGEARASEFIMYGAYNTYTYIILLCMTKCTWLGNNSGAASRLGRSLSRDVAR